MELRLFEGFKNKDGDNDISHLLTGQKARKTQHVWLLLFSSGLIRRLNMVIERTVTKLVYLWPFSPSVGTGPLFQFLDPIHSR
jgi:hypothetical protein